MDVVHSIKIKHAHEIGLYFSYKVSAEYCHLFLTISKEVILFDKIPL